MILSQQLTACIDEVALLDAATKAVQAWTFEATEYEQMQLQRAELCLRHHKYCFRSSQVAYAYFESVYDLIVGKEVVGHYRLVTDHTGTLLDDAYELYASRQD